MIYNKKFEVNREEVAHNYINACIKNNENSRLILLQVFTNDSEEIIGNMKIKRNNIIIQNYINHKRNKSSNFVDFGLARNRYRYTYDTLKHTLSKNKATKKIYDNGIPMYDYNTKEFEQNGIKLHNPAEFLLLLEYSSLFPPIVYTIKGYDDILKTFHYVIDYLYDIFDISNDRDEVNFGEIQVKKIITDIETPKHILKVPDITKNIDNYCKSLSSEEILLDKSGDIKYYYNKLSHISMEKRVCTSNYGKVIETIRTTEIIKGGNTIVLDEVHEIKNLNNSTITVYSPILNKKFVFTYEDYSFTKAKSFDWDKEYNKLIENAEGRLESYGHVVMTATSKDGYDEINHFYPNDNSLDSTVRLKAINADTAEKKFYIVTVQTDNGPIVSAFENDKIVVSNLDNYNVYYKSETIDGTSITIDDSSLGIYQGIYSYTNMDIAMIPKYPVLSNKKLLYRRNVFGVPYVENEVMHAYNVITF